MVTSQDHSQAVFHALADPTRRAIVELLSHRAHAVHELASQFEISRPAISRHLRVLRESGLVREHPSGRENYYTLEVQGLIEVGRWTRSISRYWAERLSALRQLAEEDLE